jgi:hypothetical protein
MALLFLTRTGLGHTPGLSVAEFYVASDGHIDAKITFASAEPLNGTPLRDEDLKGFLMDGVDVSADGSRCDGTFRGSSVTESDGLLLEATYDCPAGATLIEVTLYYLNALGRGHREVARIVASGNSAEGLLTGDRRALSLRLPATLAPKARRGNQLVVLSAAFVAIMLGLFVWRWRATRKL